jgi:uncharacterized protein (DUF983 family)
VTDGQPNDIRRQRDDNEHLELEMPGARRALRLLWRAFTLHCPYCGRGPVLAHWFKLRKSCGNCGRPLERGEHDYFIGGMLFNLVLAELLFAIVFVTALIVMWPKVPWDAIEIAAPLGMALSPIILYPVSKLVWLAFDLMFRPESRNV